MQREWRCRGARDEKVGYQAKSQKAIRRLSAEMRKEFFHGSIFLCCKGTKKNIYVQEKFPFIAIG